MSARGAASLVGSSGCRKAASSVSFFNFPEDHKEAPVPEGLFRAQPRRHDPYMCGPSHALNMQCLPA